MTHVHNVNCNASYSTLPPYEYTSGNQNTRKKARFPCYLKRCVHWTRNYEGDQTVCKFTHYADETNFSWRKTLNCPEWAPLCLVYCSVRKTCTERLFLHYSVAFCSRFSAGRNKTKNALYMTFSVDFPYLCEELVQPKFASPSANRAQSYALTTKYCVSMTTSATGPESATIRLVPSYYTPRRILPESEKTWWNARFRCYLRLSAQRSSNKDGLLCDPSVMSSIIHI